MKNVKKSAHYIVFAVLLLMYGCGGPTTGLSLVGDDNNPGDNPSPPIIDLLSNPNPPAPVIITAEATANSVLLKWTDTSARELGFVIVRDGVKVGETDRNISQWTDTSVLPATAYTYVIVAWNKEGSTQSPEKSVATPPLPTPRWTLPQGANIRSLATDQVTGELYAAGTTFAALTDAPNAGETDAFLAKVNPDGTLAYVKQWGTAECDNVWKIAVFNSEVFVSWSSNDTYCIGWVVTLIISRFDANGNESSTINNWPGKQVIVVNDNRIYSEGMIMDLQGAIISQGQYYFPWRGYSIIDVSVYNSRAYYTGLAGTGLADIEGYTIAVDPFAGTIFWASQWGKQESFTRGIIADAFGVYTLGGENNHLVVHHDLSGNLLWTYQDTSRIGVFSHMVADDTAVYAMGDTFNGRGLTKITNDGTVAWQTSVIGRSLALFNNILFVADDSNIIHRYDALTGATLP